MTLHLGGPCLNLGQGIFSFFSFFFFFFQTTFSYVLACFPSFLLLPLNSFIRCCGNLYSNLHLWSDLWSVFCTCHLKLADFHKASVIVCLPTIRLPMDTFNQGFWYFRKTLHRCQLINLTNIIVPFGQANFGAKGGGGGGGGWKFGGL